MDFIFDQLGLLSGGFSIALSGQNMVFLLFGVAIGILVGVLPGLGAANGVAILLPLTFGLEPVTAMIMLTATYWGALLGGSITSILFNIPGEPAALPTTFDGHPMALQGKASEAMALAFTSSAVGAMIGTLLLTFAASSIADFGLRFGAPEYFAIYTLAFASFIGMGGPEPIKTLIAIMIGLGLSTIGLDTVSGDVRMTFGVLDLIKGISFMLVVIGMIGIGELLITMERNLELRGVVARMDPRVIFRTLVTLPRYWVALIRSAAVGCWMGVLPGSGATIASMMSYGFARRFSSNREAFGKGAREGVVSPETADHAAATSAMLPTLTLGIPGSGTAAVLLGGLLMWGLQPGPMLFVSQPDFVWGLIASMYLGNVTAVVVVLLSAPLFAAILRIPFAYIGPVILVVCMIGAFAIAMSLFDIYMTLLFGLFGYLFKKLDYPIAPLVLALILGDQAEESFRQSMILSNGGVGIFWESTLSKILMSCSVLVLVAPVILKNSARIASHLRDQN